MIARIRLNPNGKWWLGRAALTPTRIGTAAAGAPPARQGPDAAGRPLAADMFAAHTYDEGMKAGTQARLLKQAISSYQRVGCDDFARGFRAGYFASRAVDPSGAAPKSARAPA